MPINRNTLLRYKTIDRMLHKGRRATLQELIDACNNALYEANGYGEVSRRTIQHDLFEMRYSSELVNRLEDHVASMRYKVDPVILLESNERLRGLEHITPLHDAIIDSRPVTITHQSFQWQEPQTFCFSPYILKEFRNRWFVFGKRHGSLDLSLQNLALDRIETISPASKKEDYVKDKSFHPQQYFSDIIGVTRNPEAKVEQVVFRVKASQVPYVTTKPLHHSQKEIGRDETGDTTFCIDIIPNFELERELLGFGEALTVIAPESLAERIQQRLQKTLDGYTKKS